MGSLKELLERFLRRQQSAHRRRVYSSELIGVVNELDTSLPSEEVQRRDEFPRRKIDRMLLLFRECGRGPYAPAANQRRNGALLHHPRKHEQSRPMYCEVVFGT